MFVPRIVKELLSRPVPSYSPLAHACSISTRSRCWCLRTLDRPSVRQPDYQSCSLWISCTYHYWNFDSTALRPQVRIPPTNFFQHQHGNFVTFWQPGPPSLTDKVRNDWRSRLKPFCACISSRASIVVDKSKMSYCDFYALYTVECVVFIWPSIFVD